MINRVGLFVSFAAGLAVYHFVLSDINWAGSSSAIATATTASLAANSIVGEPVPTRGAGLGQNRQGGSHTFSGTPELDDYSIKTVARWGANATDQHAARAQRIDVGGPTNNRSNVSEVAKGGSSQISDTIEASNLLKPKKDTLAKSDSVPLPLRAASARTWLAIAHAAARGEQGANTFFPSVTPIYSSGSGLALAYGRRAQRGARVGSTKRPNGRTLSNRTATNKLSKRKKFAHRRLKWRKPYGLLGNSNVRRQRRSGVRRVNRQRKRAWINKVFNSSILR